MRYRRRSFRNSEHRFNLHRNKLTSLSHQIKRDGPSPSVACRSQQVILQPRHVVHVVVQQPLVLGCCVRHQFARAERIAQPVRVVRYLPHHATHGASAARRRNRHIRRRRTLGAASKEQPRCAL